GVRGHVRHEGQGRDQEGAGGSQSGGRSGRTRRAGRGTPQLRPGRESVLSERRIAKAPGTAARLAVEDRLYSALAVLRVVVTLNFVALTVWRWDNFNRPGWTVVVVVAILLWTVAVQVLYSVPSRRTTWLYVADLAVTMAAL